jgi:hypothetical protein
MKFGAFAFGLLAIASEAAAVSSNKDAYRKDVFDKGVGYAGTPGQTGYVAKRAAEAVAAAIAAPAASLGGGYIGFCSVPGMACVEKRDAQPQPELYGRSARGGYIGFCSMPGMACVERRDAAPQPLPSANPGRDGYIGFCSVPGMACVKKRQEATDILNSIKRSFPDVEKNECFDSEGPCGKILAAKRAFHEERRRAAEASPAASANDVLSGVAKAHLQASSEGSAAAKKAESDSHGPDGANTLAARALGKLESAINEGVASLAHI